MSVQTIEVNFNNNANVQIVFSNNNPMIVENRMSLLEPTQGSNNKNTSIMNT